MNSHADCYGNLFPSVETIAHGQEVKGKAFGYLVEQPGVVSTFRSAMVDPGSWDECTGCAEFDACYRLSVGKLLMEMATRN